MSFAYSSKKNIFLDSNLFVKSATVNSSENFVVNKMLLYIAPKFMFENESMKDGDVYSIAWLIYELIINEIPFDGLNHYKIDKKVVESGKTVLNTLKNYFKNVGIKIQRNGQLLMK